MPTLSCVCGERISRHAIPSEHDYLLVSEEDILAAAQLYVKASARREEDEFFEVVDRKGRQVVECPRCARLYVETSAGSKEYRSYLPEV